MMTRTVPRRTDTFVVVDFSWINEMALEAAAVIAFTVAFAQLLAPGMLSKAVSDRMI